MYETMVHHTKTLPTASGDGPQRRHGVVAAGLGKRFGDLWACGTSTSTSPPGTVLGLLGHNGAGKTTAIRILTTLSVPTDGLAPPSPASTSPPRPPTCARRIGVAAQRRRSTAC